MLDVVPVEELIKGGELNGSWQDVAYTASHLAKHALKQDSTTDLEATDVLIAFKLIATAAKYIEGTLEQTVLQPACC